MLSIGVLGVSFKTADIKLREAFAFCAKSLQENCSIFFPYPIVVLSTCNRAEIYFSSNDLEDAYDHLLSFLKKTIEVSFEKQMYCYFEVDCFAHLCKVSAGLDSAILAETEIQRQVKLAYAKANNLPSCLHYVFQKALKVGKDVRSKKHISKNSPSLYGMLWKMTTWQDKKILLVGYSEINRGFLSFLKHKNVQNISLCTKRVDAVKCLGVHVFDQKILRHWQTFDVIVCASRSENYLISGEGDRSHWIFDLGVPRNVDPNVGKGVNLYNIDQLADLKEDHQNVSECIDFILANVYKLSQIYKEKQNFLVSRENLKLGMTGESGKWDYVSNIFHPCCKKDEPFKADTESCVGH